MTKPVQHTMYFQKADEPVLEAIRQEAKEQYRSLSKHIVLILKEHLEKRED